MVSRSALGSEPDRRMLPDLCAALDRCTFYWLMVLATALVIYFPNTIPTWLYGRVFEQAASPIFWLREAFWVLALIPFAWTLVRFRDQLRVSAEALVFMVIFSLLIGLAIARLVAQGHPLILIAYGLRFLQFLPVVALFYYCGRYFGDRQLRQVAIGCRLFTAFQAVTGIAQVFTMPPVYGSTFLGARPFGSLPLPHHFGMTMGMVAIIFLFTYRHGNRAWFWLAVALTFISGSRLGMLLAMLGVIALGMMSIASRHVRLLCLLALPVLGVLFFVVVSNPEISGRETGTLSDDRLVVWGRQFALHLTDPWSLLAGWGMGLGSTGAISDFGIDHWTGVFMADSFLMSTLSNFGLLGIFFYLLILGRIWSHGNAQAMPWIILVVLFANFAFLSWELFPINLLTAILLGWGFGDRSWSFQNPPPLDNTGSQDPAGVMTGG